MDWGRTKKEEYGINRIDRVEWGITGEGWTNCFFWRVTFAYLMISLPSISSLPDCNGESVRRGASVSVSSDG